MKIDNIKIICIKNYKINEFYGSKKGNIFYSNLKTWKKIKYILSDYFMELSEYRKKKIKKLLEK